MKSPQKILQIGPYPPPKGGVSVHLVRLIGILESCGHQVTVIDETATPTEGVFNLRQFAPIQYTKRILASRIVHIHSGSDMFRILHIVTAWIFRKRIVVTLHSWRNKGPIVERLQRFFFKRVDQLVCVSQPIYEQIGIKTADVRPAFLPPIMATEAELSPHLTRWLSRQKELKASVVASNAYQLDQYEQTDIYGLDLCIETAYNLVHEQNINVSFVFAVASLRKGGELYQKYQRLIEQYQLEDRFLLIHESDLSFVRLIEQADIVVRATNTDGDALSVREALYLQTPILASDVVTRPEGTRLFRSRSVEDLTQELSALIIEQRRNAPTSQNETDDSASYYQRLYAIEVQSPLE